MSTNCPDFSTIEDSEKNSHLSHCSTCRSLWALRTQSAEEMTPDCDTVEFLLAAQMTQSLDESDTTRMEAHLVSCPRCLSLAAELNLVKKPLHGKSLAKNVIHSESESIWHSAADIPDELAKRRMQTKQKFAVAGIFLIAAAVLLFYSRTKVASTTVATQPSPTAQYTLPQLAQNHAGVGRPQTPNAPNKGPNVVFPGTPKAASDLTTKAQEAIRAKNFSQGLQFCQQATAIAPTDNDANMACVIAACNLNYANAAKKHLGKLSSFSFIGAQQICTRLGVDVTDVKPAIVQTTSFETSVDEQEPLQEVQKQLEARRNTSPPSLSRRVRL